MKVSVVIPIYNVEKYIEECLCSVIGQTLKDIEIICVNDGTDDDSMQIIGKYSAKDERIRIVDKENGGLSSARNAGINVALGEYIYFLDSDDYILNNTLEILYEEARDNELDIIYFDADAFYEDKELIKTHGHYRTYYRRPEAFSNVVSGPELFASMENAGWYRPSACLQMIRREFLHGTGVMFYEGIVHEDQLYTFQTILKAERVKHIATPFYMRRVRGDSIMTGESELVSSYGYYKALCGCRSFAEKQDYSHADLVRAVEKRLHGLQNLAAGAIKNTPYDKLIPEMNSAVKIPLTYAQQIDYNLTVGRLVEEKQKRRAKELKLKKQYEKSNNDIRRSAAFRIGSKLTFIPGKMIKGLRYVRDKGLVCTVNSIGRKLSGNKRNLSPNKICVSVIIPMYNAEKSIRDCLDGLIGQTLKSIEIICVNDGSTDSTPEIIREYADKDSRIRIVDQKNSGAGIARNHGMEIAKGEYFLFLDADDMFADNLCEEAYYKAKYDRADIVLFQAYRYNVSLNKLENMDWVLRTKYVPSRIPFSASMTDGKMYQITSACPWSKLFRADFVRKNQLYFQDTKNANDVFFVRTALALAKRMTILKKRLVTYRYNDGGSTQSGKSKAPLEFYKAFKALKEELVKRGIYSSMEKTFVNMAIKETLFNYETAGTDEAKQLIRDKMVSEGNEFFEFHNHSKSFYYDERIYEEYLEKLG